MNDPGHNHGGTTGDGPVSRGSYVIDLDTFGTGNADNGRHTHSIPYGYTGVSIRAEGNHNHNLIGDTGISGTNEKLYILPPYQAFNYIIYAN